jgi:hypothetical protein
MNRAVSLMASIAGETAPVLEYSKNIVPPVDIEDFLAAVRWMGDKNLISGQTVLNMHEQFGVFNTAPVIENELEDISEEQKKANDLGLVPTKDSNALDRNAEGNRQKSVGFGGE